MKYYYSLKTTKNLDINDELFEYYPDKTYLCKLSKLNRPALFITTSRGEPIALGVLNKYGRHLKICLILVHVCYKRLHLGYSILKIFKQMFDDDFNDADILYTVCPNQFNTDSYQKLLIKSGFQLSTIKANGDLVYTYAKSV